MKQLCSLETEKRQKSEKVRERGIAQKVGGRINIKMIETCSLDLTEVTVRRNLYFRISAGKDKPFLAKSFLTPVICNSMAHFYILKQTFSHILYHSIIRTAISTFPSEKHLAPK